MKYISTARPSNYSEYFVRKSSYNRNIRGKTKSGNRSTEKNKLSSSQDHFNSKLSLTSSDLKNKKNKEEIKVEKSFQSPSLKSISISLKGSMKVSSPGKKSYKFSKYMYHSRKSKNENLRKNALAKSNRILPKYDPPKIRKEHSIKSLSKLEKASSNSFQGEVKGAKRYPMTTKNSQKNKSNAHKRLNDTIFRSLNDVKKALKTRKDTSGKNKSEDSRIKSNSLHTITIELPMSDSNKTKETMAESPPQFFPLEVDVVLSMYENQLSKLEIIELKDYKKRDKKFQIYFLGNIPSRKGFYEDEDFDDEKGNYIAKKGNNIYYRYEILDYIGKGSFGKVYIVYDHKEKQEIALKILKNFPKEENQIDLEPEILMYLKKNCTKQGGKLTKFHIIDIQEYFEFRLHKCLTMPIYEANLYEKIKELNHSGFTVDIIRRISIQLLRCLKFLKENKVIH